MRHYEIVFLVHPDQSEQVAAMIDRYGDMVRSSGGTVHRLEDWGRRQLTHSIAKLHKAHYVMMNVECAQSALEEILGAFKFSDAVLRHLVIKRDKAITEPSPLAKTEEPKTEVPKTEAPKTEEPKTEEPRSAESREKESEEVPATAADAVAKAVPAAAEPAEAEPAEAESAEAESAEAESVSQTEAPAESGQDANKTDANS